MKPRRTLRPALENLDGRVLLSAAPVAAAAADAVQLTTTAARAAAPLRLAGTIRGSYAIAFLSETTSRFQMRGSGPVAGLGQVQMAGAVDGTEGQDSIDVTLTNRRGSVTLRLGPVGESVSVAAVGQSQKVPYRVVSGTGAYTTAQGTGTAEVAILPRLATMGLGGRVSVTLRPAG